MVTKQAIDRMLKRWGNRMAISFSNGQTETCYGWIQPLNYKKMPVSDEIGVLQGGYDSESYFYLGPTSCRLDQDPQGTTVLEESSGREYQVARGYCVLLRNQPIYVWAVLRKKIS